MSEEKTINIIQEEAWAFNIIQSNLTNAQAEMQRLIAARDAFIKLLETKYDLKFDPIRGELVSKEKKDEKL